MQAQRKEKQPQKWRPWRKLNRKDTLPCMTDTLVLFIRLFYPTHKILLIFHGSSKLKICKWWMGLWQNKKKLWEDNSSERETEYVDVCTKKSFILVLAAISDMKTNRSQLRTIWIINKSACAAIATPLLFFFVGMTKSNRFYSMRRKVFRRFIEEEEREERKRMKGRARLNERKEEREWTKGKKGRE